MVPAGEMPPNNKRDASKVGTGKEKTDTPAEVEGYCPYVVFDTHEDKREEQEDKPPRGGGAVWKRKHVEGGADLRPR